MTKHRATQAKDSSVLRWCIHHEFSCICAWLKAAKLHFFFYCKLQCRYESQLHRKHRWLPNLPAITLPHCTFSVVDICKVLALDNFLHNVISINAGVVNPGGVILHWVLLPPEMQWTEDEVEHWSRMWHISGFRMYFLTISWPEHCTLFPYLGGLLGGKTGRGGRGGLSGRPASLSPSVGVSAVKPKPPEVLLPVEVFLRCVRSDRLEEQECSVL